MIAQILFRIIPAKAGSMPGLVPGLNRSLHRDRAPWDVLNGFFYDDEIRRPVLAIVPHGTGHRRPAAADTKLRRREASSSESSNFR
jgi:hypothetical protein